MRFWLLLTAVAADYLCESECCVDHCAEDLAKNLSFGFTRGWKPCFDTLPSDCYPTEWGLAHNKLKEGHIRSYDGDHGTWTSVWADLAGGAYPGLEIRLLNSFQTGFRRAKRKKYAIGPPTIYYRISIPPPPEDEEPADPDKARKKRAHAREDDSHPNQEEGQNEDRNDDGDRKGMADRQSERRKLSGGEESLEFDPDEEDLLMHGWEPDWDWDADDFDYVWDAIEEMDWEEGVPARRLESQGPPPGSAPPGSARAGSAPAEAAPSGSAPARVLKGGSNVECIGRVEFALLPSAASGRPLVEYDPVFPSDPKKLLRWPIYTFDIDRAVWRKLAKEPNVTMLPTPRILSPRPRVLAFIFDEQQTFSLHAGNCRVVMLIPPASCLRPKAGDTLTVRTFLAPQPPPQIFDPPEPSAQGNPPEALAQGNPPEALAQGNLPEPPAQGNPPEPLAQDNPPESLAQGNPPS